MEESEKLTRLLDFYLATDRPIPVDLEAAYVGLGYSLETLYDNED